MEWQCLRVTQGTRLKIRTFRHMVFINTAAGERGHAKHVQKHEIAKQNLKNLEYTIKLKFSLLCTANEFSKWSFSLH